MFRLLKAISKLNIEEHTYIYIYNTVPYNGRDLVYNVFTSFIKTHPLF
jgi:hypothetical protein